MAASTSDKITDTRNAARPVSARVSTARTAGDTILVCNGLTGWPTASKVHGVTYQIDTNSNPVEGTQIDFTAIVSGSNLASFTVVDGTDNGNAINDVVEMLPTAAWGQDLSDALMASHDRDGTLKDGAVDAAGVLAADVVTTAKILNSNVTTAKINNLAVTTDKINSTAVTYPKIDYTTLPFGRLTYSTFGSSGGQVWSSGTGATAAFDTFTTNSNTIITKQADGIFKIADAGWYMATLALQPIDNSGTPVWTSWIDYSIDNSTYNTISVTPPDISYVAGRAIGSVVCFLAATNSYIRGRAICGGGNVRFAATNAATTDRCSLTINRIG